MDYKKVIGRFKIKLKLSEIKIKKFLNKTKGIIIKKIKKEHNTKIKTFF